MLACVLQTPAFYVLVCFGTEFKWRASADRPRASENPTAGLPSSTSTFPRTAANSPHIHQVWSGHNQLLIFISSPLVNAWSYSFAGEGRNVCASSSVLGDLPFLSHGLIHFGGLITR